MANLLENKLLLQYLAAGGQDLVSGQPFGTNVNQATQQNIQTQNYMKLLQQMLAGGGKITMDNQNVNIKAPTNALNMSPNAQDPVMQDRTGIKAGTKTPSTATPKTSGVGQMDPQMLMLAGLLNPSASPLDVSGADLAGLTPQDISQALGLKLAKDEFAQKKITDLVDTMYKGALIDESRARTEIGRSNELRKWQELFRTSPLEVPGLGKLDFDTWNSLDTKTKAYSYYAFNAQQRDEEVLSYNEWARQTDDPTAYELYQLAMDDPQFNTWLTKYRESGATRLTTAEVVERRVATEKALSELAGQTYFQDPKWTEDVSDHMNEKEVMGRVMLSDNEDLERAKEKVRYIEDKIRGGGGSIENVELAEDGKTMIWTVRWPTGDTREIKYAVRN